MAWYSNLCISSFQRDSASAAKGSPRQRSPAADRPHLAHPGLVFRGTTNDDDDADNSAEKLSDTSPKATGNTSNQNTASSGANAIRNSLRCSGFSEHITNIIMQSWRSGTHSQYGTYHQRWLSFCSAGTINPIQPSVNDVLEFLYQQYSLGIGYSALNTARSALSAIISINNVPVGQIPIVYRFMKGVFNERPALPRYNVTWDVNIVLNYLKTLSPVKDISLKMLSHKLVMLLILLSGQRGQTVHLLDVRNMNLSQGYAKFTIGDPIKTTRPGHHVSELIFRAYAPDRRLCVHTALTAYLSRTLDVRGKETKLLITLKAPHKGISRDTLRRWMKDALSNAGIDLSIFAPHSTRSASTSMAVNNKIPLPTLIKAGWYNESTFSKYYNKPISSVFGDHILGGHSNC